MGGGVGFFQPFPLEIIESLLIGLLGISGCWPNFAFVYGSV